MDKNPRKHTDYIGRSHTEIFYDEKVDFTEKDYLALKERMLKYKQSQTRDMLLQISKDIKANT